MRLFGSSGIRGLANIEVTPILAQKIGATLATKFDGGAVLVGRDTRTTGEMLELALNSGLVSCGFVAGTVGIVPTPVLAWLTRELDAEAGVAISASHNPPQYNGLKIFDSKGMAYTYKQQEALEELISRGEYAFSTWSRVGRVEPMDLKGLYIEAVTELLDTPFESSILCDLFNGATSTIAPEIFEVVGTDVTLINSDPSGRFPSGNPEPDQRSLSRLGKMVRETGAEIGFGFDGDGDRMMAVDENGVAPSPDRVLAAYARSMVEARGGGTVVTHIGASMSVEEAVMEAGGRLVRTRVGDVYVTEAMLQHKAIFGGEPVGAWIHPDVHLCPDGVLSAVKLMMVLETEEKNLSELIADIPEYPTLRESVVCPNPQKEVAMESISNVRPDFGEVEYVSTVDGVRFQLEDGWVLIRPSGTEPLIRITVEAHERGRAEDLMDVSLRFVKTVIGGGK
ncbi:MAG: phosphoglucosamine mutase [Candidatus Bathyarchaeota archaeon]|jgi:phosphoglucosamine mutase